MSSFAELPLSPPLLKAVTDLGFETPTPIQAEALPILLGEPTDFIGYAATGTGKTVAFGLPLLEKIDTAVRAVQGLILCPTRELALQVAGQIDLLGKGRGIRALTIYGGAPFGDQIHGLQKGATIVVGTPGRMVDHLTRGTLVLSELHTVILDEADEMISMGFKEELEAILDAAPKEQRNTWLFSATQSREVRGFADKYLSDPRQVLVNHTEVVPELLEQLFYRVHEGDKPEIVCKLIDAAEAFYGIVFCQTKALVTDLTDYLRQRGYAADCLHGDLDQNARERAMLGFRNRRSTVLICTDVASRGLDVKDITHVINYSLPRELENYVHRIGRTARSGKAGFAMSLVTPSHRALLPRIERVTKSKIFEGRLPTRKEIGKKKIAACLGKFQGEKNFARAVELLDDSWKTALAGMAPEEVAGRFLALNFSDLFGERDPAEERPAPVVPRNGTVIRTGERSRPSSGKPYYDRGRPERPSYDRPPRKFDGPRAKFDGPRAKFDGPRAKFDGPRPKFDGPRPKSDGPGLKIDGPAVKPTGPRPKFDGPRGKFTRPQEAIIFPSSGPASSSGKAGSPKPLTIGQIAARPGGKPKTGVEPKSAGFASKTPGKFRGFAGKPSGKPRYDAKGRVG